MSVVHHNVQCDVKTRDSTGVRLPVRPVRISQHGFYFTWVPNFIPPRETASKLHVSIVSYSRYAKVLVSKYAVFVPFWPPLH